MTTIIISNDIYLASLWCPMIALTIFVIFKLFEHFKW